MVSVTDDRLALQMKLSTGLVAAYESLLACDEVGLRLQHEVPTRNAQGLTRLRWCWSNISAAAPSQSISSEATGNQAHDCKDEVSSEDEATPAFPLLVGFCHHRVHPTTEACCCFEMCHKPTNHHPQSAMRVMHECMPVFSL